MKCAQIRTLPRFSTGNIRISADLRPPYGIEPSAAQSVTRAAAANGPFFQAKRTRSLPAWSRKASVLAACCALEEALAKANARMAGADAKVNV